MSVINDMLRDLNKRNAPEAGLESSAIPQSLIEPQTRPLKRYLLVLILLLIILAVFSAWFFVNKQQGNAPQPALEIAMPVQQDAPTITDVEKPGELNNLSASDGILQNRKSETAPEELLTPNKQMPIAAVELPQEQEPDDLQETEKSLPKAVEAAPVAKPVESSVMNTTARQPSQEVASTVKPAGTLEQKASIPAYKAAVIKPALMDEPVTKQAEPLKKVVLMPDKVLQVTPSPQALDHQMAEKALRLFASGDATRAYRELVSFIAQHDTDEESRTVLANYLLQENRIAEAGDVLLNAPIHQSPALRQLKARWYAAKGDEKMALYTLNSQLPDVQQFPDYYVLLAAYFQRFGWQKEAIKTYSQLLEYDDSKADWWAGLALAADRDNDLKQATLAYRQALALPGLAPELSQFIQGRLKQIVAAEKQ